MEWYFEVAIDSLKESAIFTGVSAAAALGGLLVFGLPFFDGLGLVLLVLGAGLMLIGGALSFVSPGNVKLVNALTNAKLKPGLDDFRKTRQRAALYSVTGIFLFAYSLVLATLLA